MYQDWLDGIFNRDGGSHRFPCGADDGPERDASVRRTRLSWSSVSSEAFDEHDIAAAVVHLRV